MPASPVPSVIRPFERRDRDQLTALINLHVSAVVPGIVVSVNAVLSQLEREPAESIVDPWVAERRCLATIPALASRADGVLTLKLEDGMMTRELDRPTDSGTRAIYRLLAYHPEQHQFVVGASFYEESNWFVIDSISGERTTLDGEPVFSPSRTSLAVPIASYGEGIVDVVIRGAGPHPAKDWG